MGFVIRGTVAAIAGFAVAADLSGDAKRNGLAVAGDGRQGAGFINHLGDAHLVGGLLKGRSD